MSTLSFITPLERKVLYQCDDSVSIANGKEYILKYRDEMSSTCSRFASNPIGLPIMKGCGKGMLICRSSKSAQETRPGEATKPKPVFVKWAGNEASIRRLMNEVDMYTSELRPFQGSIVPKFYGSFVDNLKLPTFGIIILELCKGNYPDSETVSHQVMSMSCKLHTIGIMHNQLDEGDDHIIPCNGSIRLVDFTLAKRHKCNTTSQDVKVEKKQTKEEKCKELAMIESVYGRDEKDESN